MQLLVGPVGFSDAHLVLGQEPHPVSVLSFRHYQAARFADAATTGLIASRHCPLDQLTLAPVSSERVADPRRAGSGCHVRTAARSRRGERAGFSGAAGRAHRPGAPPGRWRRRAARSRASMTMFRRSSTRRTTCPACRGASCGRSAMSALLVEVVVDGGAVHADGLGDLGDGVLSCVLAEVLEGAGGLAAVLAGARGGCWRRLLERPWSDRPSVARTESPRSTPAQLGPSLSANRTNVA